MTPASPASVPNASSVPAAVPAERGDRALARLLAQHFGAVIDPHQQHGAVGISHRDDLLLGMTGDCGDAHREGREHLRLLAHRAVLALERPEHELLGARRGEPLAAHGPAERAHARRIAGHPHVLGVDDAPAVQRRLLHRRHHELAVRAEGDVVVRALPLQQLGRGLRVRKPHRHAVVMGDREPHALRREGQPADGGLHLDRCAARPCRPTRMRTCRPTRPPRRRGRRRLDRSSGAWHRSRSAGFRPWHRSRTPCRRRRR